MLRKLIISCLLLTAWLPALPQAGQGFRFSAPANENIQELLQESPHRLTIYLIPSKVKYDWTSPNSLYKSLRKNLVRNIFKKESYLLGHAFIELQTPLADSTLLTGMRVISRDEQKQYLLKDHYGLSILGADLRGRLETQKELEEKMEKYSKKGAMAFMTLLINEDAAGRMLQFYHEFQAGDESLGNPQAHYGGAFYPRYYGEGAGCSAFALAFLDISGLLEQNYDSWKVELDLPTDLMGGPYNPGNEVKLKDIRKRHHWADPGDSTSIYEPFEIYDPSLMSEWIMGLHQDPGQQEIYKAQPLEFEKSNGILIDSRHVAAPLEESIFIEREVPSIFVK